MPEDDPIARMRAISDQAREAVKEMAQNLGAFYKQLVEEGFDQIHAFTLTSELLAGMIEMGFDTGDEDE